MTPRNRALVIAGVVFLVLAAAYALFQGVATAPPAPDITYWEVWVEPDQLGAVKKRLSAKYPTVVMPHPDIGLLEVPVPEGENPEALRKVLASEPKVLEVTAPALMTPTATADDVLYPQQWSLRNQGDNAVTCPPDVECVFNGSEAPPAQGCSCNPGQTGCSSADPAAHPSQVGFDINVEGAWDTTRGQGALIGIIDGSFQVEHPDLEGALWIPAGREADCAGPNASEENAWNCFGRNFGSFGSWGVDDSASSTGFSHGGYISGLVGARGTNGAGSGIVGVAPEATMMLLEVDSLAHVAAAIRFAVDNGVTVLSTSLAWQDCFEDDIDRSIEAFNDAMEVANDAGVVYVTAAGNAADKAAACKLVDGLQCNFDLNSAAANLRPIPVRFVDEHPNMIVVASLRRDGTRPPSSNFGSNFVHVFAPGHHTWSLGYGGDDDPAAALWTTEAGTSFAAPHVAATLALVSQAKGITSLEAIEHVQATVSPERVNLVFRSDVAWGGTIDAAAAVDHTP